MWQNRLLVGIASLIGVTGSALVTAIVVGQTEIMDAPAQQQVERPATTTQATWDLSKLPKSTIDTLPDPTSPPEAPGRPVETTGLSVPVQTITLQTVGTTAGSVPPPTTTTATTTTTLPPTTTSGSTTTTTEAPTTTTTVETLPPPTPTSLPITTVPDPTIPVDTTLLETVNE